MAELDPVTIAQTGVDPITGSPLSKEVRKALFKRIVSPSSIFQGSRSLVETKDVSSIAPLNQIRETINSITTTLQEQINSIKVEVFSLTSGLSDIGNIVQENTNSLESEKLSDDKTGLNFQKQIETINYTLSDLGNLIQQGTISDDKIVVSFQEQIETINYTLSDLGNIIQQGSRSLESETITNDSSVINLQEQINSINSSLSNIGSIIQQGSGTLEPGGEVLNVSDDKSIVELQEQINSINNNLTNISNVIQQGSGTLEPGGALVKVPDNKSLSNIQEQINVIRSEIFSLTGGLTNIGSIIQQGTSPLLEPPGALVKVPDDKSIVSITSNLQEQIDTIKIEVLNLTGGLTGLIQQGAGAIEPPRGALVKESDEGLIVSTTSALQQQLDVIKVQVSVLNDGLSNIGNTIQQDSSLEQQKLLGEKEEERKQYEQQVRLGKENELERKIESALAKPIVALQNKVTNIFSNVFNALTTLFAGWLTNQGIETLKALESGNRKKLEEIKDNVLKNVLYAVGGIAAIKVGFGLIIRSVTSLASRISGIALRLALAPFRFAGNQLAKIPGIGKMFGKNPPSPPKPKPPSGGGGFLRNIGRAITGSTTTAAKTAGRGIMGALPIIGTGFDLWGAATELGKGNLTGAALYGAGAVTSLIPGLQPLSGALSVGAFAQSLTYKPQQQATPQTSMVSSRTQEVSEAPKVEPQTTSLELQDNRLESRPATVSQPQTTSLELQQTQPEPFTTFTTEPQVSMIEKKNEENESEKNIIKPFMMNLPLENTVDFNRNIEKNLLDVNIDAGKAYSMPPVVSMEHMQKITKEIPTIGTLPEPEPNVIIMPSSSAKKQESMLTSPSAPNIPMVSSANPNNFYVLYSQLNYNVVM